MILQKENRQKLFTAIFIVVAAAVFIITAIRCFTVPFSHDETATFFYYIQPGEFWSYFSHVDTNNHILNSFLSRLCFDAFGDSPFSLRFPNLLALLLLIMAVYRLSGQLTRFHSRLVLLSGFLLSFHWLSFYSACRGYGLSMSFLVLSISYLLSYFSGNGSFEKGKDLKSLALFYLFFQLAISANLILAIVILPLTLSVLIFQLLNKALLSKWNLMVLAAHILLILFWVRFSFFLQANFLHPYQAIFSAASKGYWNITFVSLINLLSGIRNNLVPLLALVSFGALMVASLIKNYHKIKTGNPEKISLWQVIFEPSAFYFLMLVLLVAAFYEMKQFLNVSYPENRMGLFFYVFFVIGTVFTIDEYSGKPVQAISGLAVIVGLVHFIGNINFGKHSLNDYYSIPERFYSRLAGEQKQSNEKITIGGQTETEFIYDFWNYRHGGELNLIDAFRGKMQLNCDYAIIQQINEPYYAAYYDELDVDKDWGIALLRRKDKIIRTLLLSLDSLKLMDGNGEYYNFYETGDSAFKRMDTISKNYNPTLIEFNIRSIRAEMPLQAWLILSIDSAEGCTQCYKRIPLNWLRYNWNDVSSQRLDLVSLGLPRKVHRLVCYLWNPEKKEIKLKMNSVKIYQLQGNGINVKFPIHNWVVPE